MNIFLLMVKVRIGGGVSLCNIFLGLLTIQINLATMLIEFIDFFFMKTGLITIYLEKHDIYLL